MWWLWVLLALAALWLGAGYYAFAAFCIRQKGVDPASRESIENGSHKKYAEPILKAQAWIDAQQPERVSIRSDDGLQLVGRYLACENARGVLILFHGYRSAWNLDFSCSIPYYHRLGFAILAVDQRANGESGGRYMTYGVKERYDVLRWIEYVNRRFGPETPIAIGGLSLGSSTVQLASGLPLPANVRAVLSDCGFTSAYEIGKHVLRWQHLPVWLLLPQVALLCRVFAGFDPHVSTIDAQKRNHTPTFFVHGGDDDFVPPQMTERNCAACAAPKQLLIVPGARHGVSYLIDQPRYEKELAAFLDRYFAHPV